MGCTIANHSKSRRPATGRKSIKNQEAIEEVYFSPPSTVDSYISSDYLGRGSFSEVMLSFHIPSQEYRALKIIPKQITYSNLLLDRSYLLKEAAFLKQLEHPKILKCYDVFEDKRNYYIGTEYCKGGSLSKRMKLIKTVSEVQAVWILKQVLEALKYCHDKHIIHRDIKLENILLVDEKSFDVKLADFGTACSVNPDHFSYGKCGTAQYMAPEVLDGKYNEKVDIWSCGIVFYILLTGKFPYPGKNSNEILLNIKASPFQPNSLNFKTSSLLMMAYLVDLLKIDPTERLSASEALNAQCIINEEQNVSNLSEAKTVSGSSYGLSDLLKKEELAEFKNKKNNFQELYLKDM